MSRLSRRLGELYDDYRTACLSKKYYSSRLSALKRWSLFADAVLAVAASSTFASAQVFKDHQFFQTLAPWAAGIVALFTVVKPLLGFDREIERLSKLVAHYAEHFDQMRRLIAEIHIEQDLTKVQEWQASSLQSSMIKFSSLEDLLPSRKRLLRFEAEVRQEIPADVFWYPEEELLTHVCEQETVTSSKANLVAINS